jgi:sulfite reductase alpha subunit-like flavoprotein
MGRAVREVLLECCRERGGLSDKQAELYVKKLQEQKRFVQELWS